MKTNIIGMLPTNMSTKKVRTSWWVPAGLILLSVIPLIFGVIQLNQLVKRCGNHPCKCTLLCFTLACGHPYYQRRDLCLTGSNPVCEPPLGSAGIKWHRWVGQLLLPFGLLGLDFSGLWIILFYPYPEGASDLLYVLRLFFGSGMVLSIILGYISIRQRDVAEHQAWMTRAYAIGMGAATQVLTGMAGALLLGKPNEFQNALLMGAAWVINLAVAEWSIHRIQPGKSVQQRVRYWYQVHLIFSNQRSK